MKIGDKVKITHKPEHDGKYSSHAVANRRACDGLSGVVKTPGHGAWIVQCDNGLDVWSEPDELTPLEQTGTSEEARALAALNVVRAAVHVPVTRWGVNGDETRDAWLAVVRTVDASNPVVRELRDELASVKAAHAEAERLLEEVRADRARAQQDTAAAEKERDDAAEGLHEALNDCGRLATENIALRSRLSAVKVAVDAVRAAWRSETAEVVIEKLDAVDRALAGVPATGEGSMPTAALAPILAAQSTPWPIYSVLVKLADAADHLLHGHDCDRHGYEEVEAARDAAREMIAGTGVEPDRFTSRFAVGDACHPRPTLTEEQAREMAEEASRFRPDWPGYREHIDRLTAALLRVSRGEHVPEKPAPTDPDVCPSCSQALGSPSPCAITHDFRPGAYDAGPSARLEVLERRLDRCDADVRDVMRRLLALERVEVEKSHADARRPRIGPPRWNSDVGRWIAFDDRGQEAVRVYRAARNGWEGLVVRPLREPIVIAAPELDQVLARAQTELGTWADLAWEESKPSKVDEQRARLHDGDPAKVVHGVAGPSDTVAACGRVLCGGDLSAVIAIGGVTCPACVAAKARETAEYDDALDVLPPRRPVEP